MIPRRLHAGRIALLAPSRTGVRHFLRVLSAWRTRVQERQMWLMVSDHILRDIGVTREEINLEVSKPFWRE
jgi:uncharacterized protein YjiS (DUF1127 family)